MTRGFSDCPRFSPFQPVRGRERGENARRGNVRFERRGIHINALARESQLMRGAALRHVTVTEHNKNVMVARHNDILWSLVITRMLW